MADYMLTILEGIDARLATYTASGQTLEDIRSYVVNYDRSVLPQTFGSKPPILLVEQASDLDATAVSIPPIMTRKILPVRFQIFVEQANYPTDHVAASLMDLVENVFFQQQLGIANLLVDVASRKNSIPTRSDLSRMMGGGAEMIINYRYTDTRAMPT